MSVVNPLNGAKPARRVVLSGLAIGGAAALVLPLAGCSQESEKATVVDITIPAENVPVGSGFIDKANQVVVVQPESGKYYAYSATCPHAGCSVTSVNQKSIICGCHNSYFNTVDGARTAGPAETGLPAKQVVREGESLHITG